MMNPYFYKHLTLFFNLNNEIFQQETKINE